jgi:rare lipoprotein A
VNFRRSEGKTRNCSVLLVLLLTLAVSGCGGRRPLTASTPPPLQPGAAPPATTENTTRASAAATRPAIEQPPEGAYTEEGNASWYGAPFHGRRASNGEIYDMNKMTAAHRTMAFGTMVKVTNLTNGKTAVVRITDRGPFVDNRIIDLSMAAAQAIESIGPGVVPVRLQVISGNDPFGGFFTVQVGAFKEKENAERLRARLNETYPPCTIQQLALDEVTFYRVRAGKISGEQAAQKFADDLHAKEGFHTMVIRLDDAQPGADQ